MADKGKPIALLDEARQCVEHGDFAAPRDRAIVWSGEGNREAAELFAQFDIAAKNDQADAWCRVEDTPAGRELCELIPFDRREELGVSRAEYEDFWRAASDRFSLSQEGDVKTFVQGAREDRNFRAIEQDNIVWDPRVLSINGQDKTEILNALDKAENVAEREGASPDKVRGAGQGAAYQAICETERDVRRIDREIDDRDEGLAISQETRERGASDGTGQDLGSKNIEARAVDQNAQDQSIAAGDQSDDQSVNLVEMEQAGALNDLTFEAPLSDEIAYEALEYLDPAPGGDWQAAADMETEWSHYEAIRQEELMRYEISNEADNKIDLSESFNNPIER